jgi:dTMP kinase
MDLGLSSDPVASFRAFQRRILHAYEMMSNAGSFLCLDATLPVKQQQRLLRDAIEQVLPAEG